MSARRSAVRDANVDQLAQSFARHLRAGNRSPRTIQSYTESIRRFDEFLERTGMPRNVAAIKREHVEAFLEDVLANYKASTAVVRFKSLQQFFRWLVDEGEITETPMARMHPPKVPHNPPPVLSTDDIKALLKATSGNTFEDRRDAAIITLFFDTGIRLSELVNLKYDSRANNQGSKPSSDIDLDRQVVFVTGKGNKERAVPIGARSVKALDRYLRVRGQHPDAQLPYLWLGRHGRMGPSGIQQMLRRRATEAGLPHLNPHAFRHTFAHQWLAGGGSETDLMMITGWASRSMIERYAASTRAERARDSHRRHSPADKL